MFPFSRQDNQSSAKMEALLQICGISAHVLTSLSSPFRMACFNTPLTRYKNSTQCKNSSVSLCINTKGLRKCSQLEKEDLDRISLYMRAGEMAQCVGCLLPSLMTRLTDRRTLTSVNYPRSSICELCTLLPPRTHPHTISRQKCDRISLCAQQVVLTHGHVGNQMPS